MRQEIVLHINGIQIQQILILGAHLFQEQPITLIRPMFQLLEYSTITVW